jgi:hypothetical protein
VATMERTAVCTIIMLSPAATPCPETSPIKSQVLAPH